MLNRFVTDTEELDIPFEILYYPFGSGNDFARDLGHEKECNPFPIPKYLPLLPCVRFGGQALRHGLPQLGETKNTDDFSSIFKGKHVKHKDRAEILTGHEITVEFSAPRPLQVGGETILNMRSYTARSGVKVSAAV